MDGGIILIWAAVSDDEIFHRVSLIFSRCGIAVPQQQVKPGGVPSLQDGTHIEHRFNSQDSYRPFVRRYIVLVLKQGHSDSELSIPIHTDVQRTYNGLQGSLEADFHVQWVGTLEIDVEDGVSDDELIGHREGVFVDGMGSISLQNVSTGPSIGRAGHGYPVSLLSLRDTAAVPVSQVGDDIVPKTQASQLTLVQ